MSYSGCNILAGLFGVLDLNNPVPLPILLDHWWDTGNWSFGIGNLNLNVYCKLDRNSTYQHKINYYLLVPALFSQGSYYHGLPDPVRMSISFPWVSRRINASSNYPKIHIISTMNINTVISNNSSAYLTHHSKIFKIITLVWSTMILLMESKGFYYCPNFW